MAFVPTNQQCQSTEGKSVTWKTTIKMGEEGKEKELDCGRLESVIVCMCCLLGMYG